MSCGCGKKKCNGKCGISPSVLQINNNECTLFHKVEIPAVMGDETTNPPKTGAYRNALLYYEASGNSYLYSSDGIPTKLTGVVSDYEVLTNKPSINGVVLIKNKTLADLGIISAIDSAVADEATARTNADNALSDRITTNANNIAANATAISNEVTARTNADNTLSARISGNTTAINNEKTARENADTALSNRITANANAISAETTARENADNALSGRITANADAISGEKTARENADAGLQDQITAVKATADSAVQPDDIDKTVMSDLAVDSNSSTAQVILKESKVNLKTGATSSEQTSLPVASSSQAGVMNSATYDAVTSNTSNINAIMNGAVAITGLPANPSQSDLTTAWQNETGLSTLINRASVYDVTNNKVWTYYTNDTTWHAASNTSSVTVNTFTNSSEGTIKGSTNIGQVFAENDGTGSVNGWDALSDAVSNNTSKLAGIESGAEVNVQSDWNVSDSSSDAYIKNKPTIGNGTLTIQKNGTTIDTFTANSTTNKTVNITVPTVNDATLTIQKNGDTVQTFTANSSSNKTANIEVPTKTSELDNDAGFIANDTHQVCGEGGDITLDTTTFEPLEMNHLSGNTSQQTYSGKNLYCVKTRTVNGITMTVNADGSFNLSGTATATVYMINETKPISLMQNGATYTCWANSNIPSGVDVRLGVDNEGAWVRNLMSAMSGSTTTRTFTADTSGGDAIRCEIYVPNGTTVNISNMKIQLEAGSSATNFEPFTAGPAPNPDYPQAVQTVTGENVVQICGKNLFDKDANQYLYGYFDNGSLQIVSASSSGRNGVVYLPCEPSTTYTINAQSLATCNIRAISTTEVLPANGVAVPREIASGFDAATFTTPSSAHYIVIRYRTISAEETIANNIQTIMASLQVEKGSTATAYEPYQGQSYEVNLSLLPAEYQEVEYIESSAVTGQAINLKYYSTANTRFEIDYMRKSSMGAAPVFGARHDSTASDTRKMVLWAKDTTTGEAINFGSVDSGYASGTTSGVRHITSNIGANLYYNGTQVYADDTAVKTTDNLPLYMFAMNSNGNADVRTNAIKLYSFKLYEDTTLTADLVPCYRVADNVIGLYDLVRHEFYQALGASTLSKGPNAANRAIELCKIGDYQDYIYKDGSDWKIHKAINKAVLNGSENWAVVGSGTAGYYYKATYDGQVYNTGGKSSHYEWYPYLSTGDTAGKQGFAVQNGTTSDFTIRVRYGAEESVANYTNWLSTNNVSVYYIPQTATDTEITNEALIAQLENLWDADGVEGETNIFTASDGVNERAILSVCQYPSHLPIATKTKLGTIVVGHGLDIEADGKLDVIVDDDFSTESEHPVQNKVITNALAGKADNTDLSTVAMTGSYDDLTGKPTIPTVNNATLTIQKNGTNVATFTANSSTNVTANITAPVVTMTTTDPGEGGALAANNFIGVYV